MKLHQALDIDMVVSVLEPTIRRVSGIAMAIKQDSSAQDGDVYVLREPKNNRIYFYSRHDFMRKKLTLTQERILLDADDWIPSSELAEGRFQL